MPKVTTKLDDEPLFTDDDPFILEVPKVGEWRLSNYEVNPPDDSEVNPETRPITYIVTMMASMAYETEEDLERGLTPNADDMAEKLTEALKDGRLTVSELGTTMNDVGTIVRKAVKARTARASGRPTKGRRH